MHPALARRQAEIEAELKDAESKAKRDGTFGKFYRDPQTREQNRQFIAHMREERFYYLAFGHKPKPFSVTSTDVAEGLVTNSEIMLGECVVNDPKPPKPPKPFDPNPFICTLG